MDAPLLIDAPQKETSDRYPAWSKRADWSSGDALLAFWSAHPPALRDAFLNTRAQDTTANFWTQIKKQRAEQSRLWQARRELIESHAEQIAKLPADSLHGIRHRQTREEYKEKLLSLRARMRASRGEIRRCLRYLRMIQPKIQRITKLPAGVKPAPMWWIDEDNNVFRDDEPTPDHFAVCRGPFGSSAEAHQVLKPKTGHTYQVLSLWQPWASMIAWGLKQYETRSWTTPHRGVLLIHAAKHWTEAEKAYCRMHPFNKAIADRLGGAISDLPFGAIIAVAELVNIYPTATLRSLTADERAVGNYAPGRFAWKLEKVRELKTPIPVKGGQKLFSWTGVIDG